MRRPSGRPTPPCPPRSKRLGRRCIMRAMAQPVDPNRSLIRPRPVSEKAIGKIEPVDKFPPGFYKSIVLDTVDVLSALLLGYAFRGYLEFGFSVWYGLAALLLFGSISVVQMFLTKSGDRRALVVLGETVAFVAWFAGIDFTLFIL